MKADEANNKAKKVSKTKKNGTATESKVAEGPKVESRKAGGPKTKKQTKAQANAWVEIDIAEALNRLKELEQQERLEFEAQDKERKQKEQQQLDMFEAMGNDEMRKDQLREKAEEVARKQRKEEKRKEEMENLQKLIRAEQLKDGQKKVANLVTRIRRLLQEQNKYRKELTYQIEMAASVVLVWRKIRNEVLCEDFKMVLTEKSREGDFRMKTNPLLQIFAQVSDLNRRNLKALGMNKELHLDDPGDQDKDDPMQSLMRSMRGDDDEEEEDEE